MKLKALKPLYIGGAVVDPGKTFETTDVHGKQLVKKDYAAVIDAKAEKAAAEKAAADKAAADKAAAEKAAAEKAAADQAAADKPAAGKAAK